MFFEVVLALLLTGLVFSITSNYLSRRTLPPGPFPLPIIGNLFSAGDDAPFTMDYLGEKYGDIYTLTFPIGNFVVVNNGELLHEAFVKKKDDFAGRPGTEFFPLKSIFEGKDILSADFGPRLIFRRKIVSAALHVFGKGVEEVEKRSSNAIDEFIQRIEAMDGQPFCPIQHIKFTQTSIISEWLWSVKYDFGDPTVDRLIEFPNKFAKINQFGTLVQFLPFLRYLPSKYMDTFNDVINIRETIFEAHFNNHLKTYDPSVVRDITDALIAAYETERSKDRSKDVGEIHDVKFLTLNLIFATTDTGSSILSWLFLYSILREDVQEKIYSELVAVIGEDRSPSLKDAPNLHYLHAALCEAMRISGFLPLPPAHQATRDTELGGYKIPKGTCLLYNLWRIHTNAKDWKDPHFFNPDRFLDADEKFVGWDHYKCFKPFADGRRYCLGAALGKIELVLLASKLFHRFQFKVPPGQSKPPVAGKPSAVRYPKDYNVVAIDRR